MFKVRKAIGYARHISTQSTLGMLHIALHITQQLLFQYFELQLLQSQILERNFPDLYGVSSPYTNVSYYFAFCILSFRTICSFPWSPSLSWPQNSDCVFIFSVIKQVLQISESFLQPWLNNNFPVSMPNEETGCSFGKSDQTRKWYNSFRFCFCTFTAR